METSGLAFIDCPLDRVTSERHNEDFVMKHLNNPDSLVITLYQLKVPLISHPNNKEQSSIAWKKWGEVKEILKIEGKEQLLSSMQWVLLGLRNGIAYFALDISEISIDSSLFSDIRMVELRAAALSLNSVDGTISCYARSVIDWHNRNRFCANCGANTSSIQGGLKRICKKCNSKHFPRTDPCAIMLVTKKDKCLLGRKSAFPKGIWTTLAGFIEVGESIEEGTRREVMEEAGIQVGRVQFLGSQPWPYPAQIMLGFYAEALNEDIRIDKNELEDAKWYTKEEVLKSLSRAGWGDSIEFHIPPPIAIAHHLIKNWAESKVVLDW